MTVVIALVVLLLAVALPAIGGWALTTRDDGSVRLLAGLIGAFVVASVLIGIVTGLRPGRSSTSEREPARSATAEVTDEVPLRRPTIELTAVGADGFPPVPAAVGGLTDGAVVLIGVSGLDPGSRASVHQCPTGALAAGSCRPGLPFVVSEHQRALVLVDLEDRFEVDDATLVDCATPTACSMVIFGSSRLEVVTVFGGPAPPPVTIDAEPARLPPGGTTTATARRLPPGATASFVVCRPAGGGVADCGSPTRPVAADGAGEATANVEVGPGRCPRGATCAIAVVVGDGGPRAFAKLHLIGRSGATYEAAQLRIGGSVAALLLLVALVLLRRTDWTPVDGDPFAGVHLPEDPFADEAAP